MVVEDFRDVDDLVGTDTPGDLQGEIGEGDVRQKMVAPDEEKSRAEIGFAQQLVTGSNAVVAKTTLIMK
jgi:hypothetical protein